jgi:hypothetical protein
MIVCNYNETDDDQQKLHEAADLSLTRAFTAHSKDGLLQYMDEV